MAGRKPFSCGGLFQPAVVEQGKQLNRVFATTQGRECVIQPVQVGNNLHHLKTKIYGFDFVNYPRCPALDYYCKSFNDCFWNSSDYPVSESDCSN